MGIPRKESGLYNYTVDITTTPNNSIVETFSKIEKGTYYSLDAVSKDLVETMESYAKSPAYGEETTLSIPLNMENFWQPEKRVLHLPTCLLPSFLFPNNRFVTNVLNILNISYIFR